MKGLGGSGGSDGGSDGGIYGGGGARHYNPGTNSSGRDGGQGAVRIIWGDGRSYPSTNTGDV
jgi:hypothetical protein